MADGYFEKVMDNITRVRASDALDKAVQQLDGTTAPNPPYGSQWALTLLRRECEYRLIENHKVAPPPSLTTPVRLVGEPDVPENPVRRTFLRPYMGMVYFRGSNYVVGMGMLEVTDPKNPVMTSWWNVPKSDVDILDRQRAQPLI